MNARRQASSVPRVTVPLGGSLRQGAVSADEIAGRFHTDRNACHRLVRSSLSLLPVIGVWFFLFHHWEDY